MPISDDFLRVELSRIVVLREDRDRRTLYSPEGVFINSDGLLESIRDRGVINPIIVNREFVLVAGERRLEASRCAGKLDIPVRFVEDLSETESKIIELEENLKRLELPWRDEVLAITHLHGLYKSLDASHTVSDTEKATGYGQLHIALRVAKDMESPRISSATSVRQAYNTLSRLDDRATADAVNDIIDAGASIFNGPIAGAGVAGGSSNGGDGSAGAGAADAHPRASYNVPQPAAPSESILNVDFKDWIKTYEGPTFNFIHCDFPYGINVFAGEWSGKNSQSTYSDEQEVYEELISVLCSNLDRLMSHSAHLMFWLTADIDIQFRTIEKFRRLAPSLIFHMKPLVWHKTDNLGIMADPKRAPRHVYETAIVAAREDRMLVKPISDAYGAPTDKSHHPSTKPEPVLRHFLQMYCDENTRLFDPTCGSGSALRAAESLGAKHVLGLEKDPEHFKSAQSALRNFRTLRKVAK